MEALAFLRRSVADGMDWAQREVVPPIVDGLVPHLVAKTLPGSSTARCRRSGCGCCRWSSSDLTTDPKIRDLVAEQGRGLVGDAAHELRESAANADDRVESAFLRLLRRPPRTPGVVSTAPTVTAEPARAAPATVPARPGPGAPIPTSPIPAAPIPVSPAPISPAPSARRLRARPSRLSRWCRSRRLRSARTTGRWMTGAAPNSRARVADSAVLAPDDPHRYAGLVSRVAAIVTDLLLLTGAVLIVSGLPPAASNAVRGFSPSWLSTLCSVAGAVLPVLYFTGCWWLAGQTVGGLLFGTQLRRSSGARVSLLRSALRALFGLMFAPLWLVGLLGVLADGRRRAWHDRVFGTVVRYAPRSRNTGGSPG